jgi:hypothetical protein
MEHKRTLHSVLGGFAGFHPCDLELLLHKGGAQGGLKPVTPQRQCLTLHLTLQDLH